MRHGGDDGRQRKARLYARKVCRIERKLLGLGFGDCQGVEAKAWSSNRMMTPWDLRNQVAPGVKKVYCSCRFSDAVQEEAKRRGIELVYLSKE